MCVGGGAVGGTIFGGLATCWTVVLWAPGIVAGGAAGEVGGAQLGKSTDFYFTIVGYNNKGMKIVKGFSFINKKPVKRIMQELPMVTGLAMGELRPVSGIMDAVKRSSGFGTSQEK